MLVGMNYGLMVISVTIAEFHRLTCNLTWDLKFSLKLAANSIDDMHNNVHQLIASNLIILNLYNLEITGMYQAVPERTACMEVDCSDL